MNLPDRAPPDRNLGEQPLATLLANLGLKPKDLVAASGEHLTHKMVSRACKGRWLTPNARAKLLRALSAASGKSFSLPDLFDY